MADDNQDPAQKTEDPTSKKLGDARKKGQVVSSREVTSFLLLLLIALLVGTFSDNIAQQAKFVLAPFIDKADLIPMDLNSVSGTLRNTIIQMMFIIAMPLGMAMIIAIASNYLQHGHVLTAESMKPKLNRISPLAGFKRIFSLKSVVEFLKGLFKIIIVAVGAWFAIRGDLNSLKTLPAGSLQDFLAFLVMLVTKMLIAVCIAMFFIAVLDYAYQYYEYIKSMKMSKQDIKDEYKQQEGDPHVKQRLRQIRAERAQNRMMQAVPDADVVVTNPTHFAVALKYDQNEMRAPVVVAKGADLIAAKIREIAEENDIPLVRNPPLARALFDNVDLDVEVPVDQYKAVAEVISYVYKLKKKFPKKQMGMS